jgi:hypothetical protein
LLSETVAGYTAFQAALQSGKPTRYFDGSNDNRIYSEATVTAEPLSKLVYLLRTAAPSLRCHLSIAELLFSKWDGGSVAMTTGERSPHI